EPIRVGGPRPDWLGGTRSSMAPEQEMAVQALRAGRAIPATVDGRADIYALGLLLYTSLGGRMTAARRISPPALRTCKPQVSPGLSDVIHKCLSFAPEKRYATAGALADDLKRHLSDRPLQGVRNRSLQELIAKWRRRRPRALPLVTLLFLIVGLLIITVFHT